MPLSLYLDDCADDDILAALLRQVGHRVSTPRGAGTTGSSDVEHLDYAAHHGYTLLTKDPDDFMDLHHRWQMLRRTHSGILLIYEDKDVGKNLNRAQIVLAIDNLISSAVPSPTMSTTSIIGAEPLMVESTKFPKSRIFAFSFPKV